MRYEIQSMNTGFGVFKSPHRPGAGCLVGSLTRPEAEQALAELNVEFEAVRTAAFSEFRALIGLDNRS